MMFGKYFKKINAFSLVELLVTLIIVSLIMGIMAPAITKKLSSTGITIGNNVAPSQEDDKEDDNQNQNQDEEHKLDKSCETGINEACCAKFGAIYISSTTHPGYQGDPICFTQFNAGDDYRVKDKSGNKYVQNYAKIGVKMLGTGETCSANADSLKSCCWSNVSVSTDTANYSTYPGAKRNICTLAAGKRICENWAPPGALPGTWRLPTTTELEQLSTAIAASDKSVDNSVFTKYLDDKGLQFCDGSVSNLGSNKCTSSKNCKGAYANDSGTNCTPYHIMATGDKNKGYYLSKGKFILDGGTDYAKSVRCVTTDPINQNLANKYQPGDDEPANQADCDKISGDKKDLLFISAKHTGTKNICMFKYNAGDDQATSNKDAEEFAQQYGVQLVATGKTCNLTTDGKDCCWFGDTGSQVTGSWAYGGKNRIVCTYSAAEKICNNYTKKGGIWRLPEEAELKNLSIYVSSETASHNFISKYSNTGLNLCEHSTDKYGSNRCYVTNTCNGATQNSSDAKYECFPYTIWSKKANGATVGIGYKLDNGMMLPHNSNDHARSVRCVTNDIKHNTTISDLRVGGDTEPVENATDDEMHKACPKGTMFINGKYVNGKNICMFKYNAGDNGTTTLDVTNFASRYGVQLVQAGETCNLNATGHCCWYNNTSKTYTTDPPYSGRDRIICMYNAAREICNNYNNNDGKSELAGTAEWRGHWRLPTEKELEKLSIYITASSYYSPFISKYTTEGTNGIYKEIESLNLCDYKSDGFGSNYCSIHNACNGAIQNTDDEKYECYPYTVMTQKNDGSEIGTAYQLNEGYFKKHNAKDHARSVRCVTDDMTKKYDTDTDIIGEPKSQADCPDYSVFIHKKYTGTGSSNLCMLKYNPGDDVLGGNAGTEELKAKLFENVTVVAAGQTCKNAPCCWQGTTAKESTETWSYSGKKRTVCNKEAGQSICSKLDGDWRLPTKLELEAMSRYITASSSIQTKFLSKYLDEEGLQLCDGSSGTFGANYCKVNNNCNGAEQNTDAEKWECYAYTVMSNDGEAYQLVSGHFKIHNTRNHARSVRCVTSKKIGAASP